MLCMVAYSMDLRERVMAAVDAGEETQEQIAKRFLVSSRWIRKLIARRVQTGEIGPRPNPGGRKPLIQGEAAQALRAAIAENPDATLHEVREAIGFKGCLVTVWRTIKRLNITLKKSPCGRRSNSIRKSSLSARSGANGWERSTRTGSSSSTRATRRRP
jgi:transposase